MNSKPTDSYLFKCISYTVLAIALLVSNSIFAQPTNPISINTHNLSQEYSSNIRHWYHETGDGSDLSIQDLDKVAWEYPTGRRGGEYRQGVQWYRADIRLEGSQNDFDILALSVAGLASAFEVYWDGNLIDTGGVVADSFEEEVSGPIKKIVRLKRELTSPGDHTIAIRLSNFHTGNRHPLGNIDIGYHYNFLYDYSYKSSSRVFVGGASLIAGLFCIAMFFAGSRHRSYLLFALYCFITLFFDTFTILTLYNEINVEHLEWIFLLFKYGIVLSMLFFVTFVVYTYEIPRKAYVLLFAILMSVISIWLQSSIPNRPLFYFELLPALAGVLLLYSMYRRTTGSVAAFVGLIIWRIFKYPNLFSQVIDSHLFLYLASDIIFLFCIVLSISRMIHAQNTQLQEITLRSSRLEVDLLKKNIQPHFILNTLQSIMNWIKKEPDNALQLIEALAEEFRMINRIADKKLIPLHQEIDLCNTHLKLMGFRMGSTYELITDGLCEDGQVPPMIFHTLIENALTHSFETQEGGTIRLACERNDQQIVYHLSNNGSRLREVSRKSEDEIQEGMGLKYIRARLNESFFDKWSVDHTLDDDQWKVTIVIEQPPSP
ncbi:MAG: histidine kinase [Gemmatimonadales bacterium]|nr:histidine kinase [Gemmatimonadales bacterium]